MGGGKDQNQNQDICENNMLSALKEFNKSISSGNNSNLKQELGKLQGKLTHVGDNVGEEFKESYNSVVNLIGECAKRCPDNFNISSDQDPLFQMYRKIIGKKIPSESVKQKNWNSENIGITENSSISFPAESTHLKKALKKFLINLLKQIYPNKETVPASKQGLKTRNMKTIKTVTKTKSDPKSQNTNKQLLPPSQSPKIKNHQSQGKRSVIKTSKHDSANPQKLTEVQPLEKMETSPNFNPSQESIKVSQMKSTNLSKQTNSGEGSPVNLNKSIEGPKNVQLNHEPGGAALPSKNNDILNKFNNFNVDINGIIDKYIQTVINGMNNGKKFDYFSGVMSECKSTIEVFNDAMDDVMIEFDLTQLNSPEFECINNIKNCLTNFLKNSQVFEGELNTNAPILVLYKQLTGKGPTIEDITKSFGNPKDSEAISSMKKSDDDKLNKSFKNCLAALMRVYNVKGNINRYLSLGESMGEGSFGVVQSITLSGKNKEKKNKEKVFKFFKNNNDDSQKQIERNIHTNKSLHNQHSRMKNEEKALQKEINDLKSKRKSLQETRSNSTDAKLNKKIKDLNKKIKEKKRKKQKEINKLESKRESLQDKIRSNSTDAKLNKKIEDLNKKINEKKRKKQEEINDLKSKRKSLQDKTRSNSIDANLDKEIEALNNEIKEKKLEKEESALARNLVINPKTIGHGIETKKGEMDLLAFVNGLKDKSWIDDKIIKQLVQDMVDAVNFYHTKFKRIHYDIKPENFIVFQKGKAREKTRSPYVCKLCDPDFTTKINEKYTFSFAGTPEFMPGIFFDNGDVNYEIAGLCVNNACGVKGAQLGIAMDDYELYTSLAEFNGILKKIGGYQESCDFIDNKMSELMGKNNNFSMFSSIDSLEGFLVANGATWENINSYYEWWNNNGRIMYES